MPCVGVLLVRHANAHTTSPQDDCVLLCEEELESETEDEEEEACAGKLAPAGGGGSTPTMKRVRKELHSLSDSALLRDIMDEMNRSRSAPQNVTTESELLAGGGDGGAHETENSNAAAVPQWGLTVMHASLS